MSPRAGLRRDDGAVTVELIAVVAVVAVLLGLAMLVARGVTASIDVGDAATVASRAASLATTPAQARTAAQDAARSELAAAHSACRRLRVDTDTTAFRPGGSVTVAVTCRVNLADLPIAAGTSRTITARSTTPIDTYVDRQGGTR